MSGMPLWPGQTDRCRADPMCVRFACESTIPIVPLSFVWSVGRSFGVAMGFLSSRLNAK